jgi:hypothetical protein
LNTLNTFFQPFSRYHVRQDFERALQRDECVTFVRIEPRGFNHDVGQELSDIHFVEITVEVVSTLGDDGAPLAEIVRAPDKFFEWIENVSDHAACEQTLAQRLAREQAARAEQVRAANAQEAARQYARLARRQKKHGIAPE